MSVTQGQTVVVQNIKNTSETQEQSLLREKKTAQGSRQTVL